MSLSASDLRTLQAYVAQTNVNANSAAKNAEMARLLVAQLGAGMSAILGEPVLAQVDPFMVPTLSASVGVRRTGPTSTTLFLPSVMDRQGIWLNVFDWSTGIVTAHDITLVPAGIETIMQLPNFSIRSTPDQFAWTRLRPSTTLGGWYFG